MKKFAIRIQDSCKESCNILEVKLKEYPDKGSIALMYKSKEGWYTAYEIDDQGIGKTFNGSCALQSKKALLALP